MSVLALDLTRAGVLLEGRIARETLSVEQGRVVAAPVGRAVDMRGYLVLPGIVDIHGDGFERHLAPRRGAMPDMEEGVVAAEAELAVNGITTAVLAQFQSWEGGVRAGGYADKVFAAVRAVRDQVATDLLLQLRFETHLLDDYAALPDRLAQWGVGYVVFNDHLPHDRLAAGRTPPRLTGQALKAGRSPETHLALLQALHRRSGEVPGALDRLCAILSAQGVRMGSHDDRAADSRAAWCRRGVRIAEFPETSEAARAARDAGDGVVLGAPNVVRGASHNGNVSATDMVRAGLCDALASDYHYPSLRRAALGLVRMGHCDLAAAWHLVSAGPARLLGLTDRGNLAEGQRADLVILDAQSLRVAGTLAGGVVSYLSGALAARFMAAR